MNKTFWFVTLPAFLKSKAYVWGLFGLVVVLGIAYFVYAWTGHAPDHGFPIPPIPDQAPIGPQ